MDQLALLDAIEKYLRHEMTAEEKAYFEDLRRTNPEVDQLVVEHQMFMHQLENYGQHRTTRQLLQQTHQHLVAGGQISETPAAATGGKVIEFWNKYKRTVAVAASIGGATALLISLGMQMFVPKTNTNLLQNLGRKVNALESRQNAQTQKINQLIDNKELGPQLSGGSSFLIDGDGYLITNYHVVNGANTVVVTNKGQDFIAKTVYTDGPNDIAILKIEDKEWSFKGTLPYGIRKTAADLGEEIFTLGFPRNEIVYNRGYLSASSGYNNDSLSIQLSISANPGNSGGPVLDKNGDIIGILSNRDKQANDVVFATKAVNINRAIEELKKDTAFKQVQAPSANRLRSLDRVQQIKKIQDCVYMVKAY